MLLCQRVTLLIDLTPLYFTGNFNAQNTNKINKSKFFSSRQVLNANIVLGSSFTRCLDVKPVPAVTRTLLFHNRFDYS